MAESNVVNFAVVKNGGREPVIAFLREMLEAVENGTPPFDNAIRAIMVTECHLSDNKDKSIFRVTTSGMYLREELWLLEQAKQQVIG
jgi:hypothetical protein